MSLIDDLVTKLEDAQRIAEAIKASEATVVLAGQDLQAAIDKGGNVIVEDGAVFSATKFIFNKPVNFSGKCKLIGNRGPAIHVTPYARGITITDVECLAPDYGDVIQLGNGDETQTLLNQVPSDIQLIRVKVPAHNRKRALAIHSTKTRIIDCDFLNVWDSSSSNSDSHPWAIMNTPGDILIEGGSGSGGSELGLIGGDTMKIPGVEPSNIVIKGTPEKNYHLFRPIEWKTDGTDRAVKCGFEAKTGHNVLMKYVTIENNWKSDQPDAFAVQLTPKSGGSITNFLMEDCIVRNSASFCGVTAYDPTGNPVRTTGLNFKRIHIELNRTAFGGNGRVFLLQGGIGTIDVEELWVTNPGGNAFMYTDTKRIERVSVKNCTSPVGTYNFTFGGNGNGNLTGNVVDTLVVEGNTFSGAANLFKANFPQNTYV